MKRRHRVRLAPGKMQRAAIVLLGIALVVLTGSAAFAHPATERYVPIGYWQSIGVSGTYLGPLLSVAPEGGALRFRDSGQEQSVRITDATRIYIDRSHLGLPNLIGTRADLRPGVTAEVRMSTSDAGAAAWIKIRAER